jgi:arylsulfatase A-like enzyme
MRIPLLAAFLLTTPAQDRPPNVVLIMTDNHGAWTLGCYGNRDIRTPHIDRLAGDGVRYTRCFSSNAVCSPTRATFLTGLLPSQHGVHCYLGANEHQMGPGAKSQIGEFRSLPKILSDAGYVCGLSGKWHLGGNLTPQDGFTSWITMPAGHTTTFHGAPVIENGAVRKEPQHLTDLWTDRAVRFVEENRARPFFLFLAYNGPYGLGESLADGGRNRHTDHYADKELPSFPRQPAHPWLHNNKQFLSNPKAIRRYASEVSAVDDGVGRVLEKLRDLGLEKDTVVVFTADQGWAGGQHGIWGMGDHTRPLTAFDEELQIPMIWRHPGRIPAGKTSDALISNYDFLPTLVSYLGLKDRTASPGRDFSPGQGGATMPGKEEVFYEFENTRAIRTPDWKLIVRRFPKGPDELYDLKADPGETRNLVDDPAHAATRDALLGRLEPFFDRVADPQYDLWRGGKSKVRRIVAP